ncbi:hypothetical protein AMTRI_Chr07g27760 [Amborella trichopoda]
MWSLIIFIFIKSIIVKASISVPLIDPISEKPDSLPLGLKQSLGSYKQVILD